MSNKAIIRIEQNDSDMRFRDKVNLNFATLAARQRVDGKSAAAIADSGVTSWVQEALDAMASDLAGQISSLSGDIGSAQDDISALQGTVSGHTSTLSTHTSQISTHTSQIATLSWMIVEGLTSTALEGREAEVGVREVFEVAERATAVEMGFWG